jgi:hypothetical protein
LLVEEGAAARLAGGLEDAAGGPEAALVPEFPLAAVPAEERLARFVVGVEPALSPWMSMIRRQGFGSRKAE